MDEGNSLRNKIPFVLVTGFLGSGKTTLLKKMIDCYADNKKVAIIQNEFAPASIDGDVLRKSGKDFEILEINKGSVFCVCLLNDFISSLSSFIEQHNPDLVILEASGLSDPIAIAQVLQSSDLIEKLYLSYIWCIVDAVGFLKIRKMNIRTNHQVRVADTVIINKTDLSEEKIPEIEAKIIEINPFAKILKSSYCDVPIAETDMQIDIPAARIIADSDAAFESCGRPDVVSFVMKETQSLNKEQLKYFLERLVSKTIRIKGFVKSDEQKGWLVQACNGKYEICEIDEHFGPTELIFMGYKIKLSRIESLYKKALKR